MELPVIHGMTPGSEVNELASYDSGFYIINNTLWLKAKDGVITFIWSEVDTYVDITGETIETKFSTLEERGDTISEEFLLKVLAIAKEPSLIKDI